MPRPYTYRDFERLKAMRAMYENGFSLDEVGLAFGITEATVLYFFRRYGIPRRPDKPKRPREVREAKLCEVMRMLAP